MSELLRRIIKSKTREENPFFKDSDSRIIELTADRGEVFTGYYEADDGTYYIEKDWLDHQRQLELEKLAEQEYIAEKEKLAAEREARALKIAALEAMQKKNKTVGSNSTKVLSIVGALIALSAIIYFVWPNSPSPKQPPADIVVVDTLQTSIRNNKFGNASITGTDVRMRAEPNLKGQIVTYFPEEGERVEMLQPANDSINWAQVRRDNGTTGWVYAKYVKPDSIN